MRYSIQNSSGDVYGIFPLPEAARLSCEQWAGQLTLALEDILGKNGVRVGDHPRSYKSAETVKQVTVDIVPDYGKENARIERVHNTIGIIASASLGQG